MLETIIQHMHWYPLMGIRDVYKLIFQGVMGSEHLIASAEGFISYLQEELEPLQPDPGERLLEPIRPDQTLFRINLRPFKALQMPVEVLIPALLETARSFKGDPGELRDAWKAFVLACEGGQLIGFEVNELHNFTIRLDELGFPAFHHSEGYERAYQPAYRLISAQTAANIGLFQSG